MARSSASAALPRWQRRPDDRPHALMESAFKLLMRDGYRRIRLDDVADDAGVSKATVYCYFANKDDLLTRTVASRIAEKQAAIESQLASAGGSASERLRIFLHQFWTMSLTEQAGLWQRLLASEIVTEAPDVFAVWAKGSHSAMAIRRATHQGRTTSRRVPARRGRCRRGPADRIGVVTSGSFPRAFWHAAVRPMRLGPALRLGDGPAPVRASLAQAPDIATVTHGTLSSLVPHRLPHRLIRTTRGVPEHHGRARACPAAPSQRDHLDARAGRLDEPVDRDARRLRQRADSPAGIRLSDSPRL